MCTKLKHIKIVGMIMVVTALMMNSCGMEKQDKRFLQVRDGQLVNGEGESIVLRPAT